MKTFVWLVTLLLNVCVLVTFGASMFEGDVSIETRMLSIVVVVVFLAICWLLVSVRLHHPSAWGISGMTLLCWAVPALWLAGSLDHGMISGLEFGSLFFAALLGWGSWRIFKLLVSKHRPAVERELP